MKASKWECRVVRIDKFTNTVKRTYFDNLPAGELFSADLKTNPYFSGVRLERRQPNGKYTTI